MENNRQQFIDAFNVHAIGAWLNKIEPDVDVLHDLSEALDSEANKKAAIMAIATVLLKS